MKRHERNLYVHYGATSFDKDLFIPVRNNYLFLISKPIHGTGFWASSVNARFGWKDWCKEENFMECKEECSFKFVLDKGARVLHLRRFEDYGKVNPEPMSTSFIDFERLSKEWDAIELHISEDKTGTLNARMYGWDCDSILIMNPDIIVGV